ncbi:MULTISPECIES: tetratricopeptide repeat protein [unclassified Phenylobacterium]|uniref:O-linked N-acetylglucosamine transferase, SPINDLY family protein n=1 Tax=unclassified Phenylobacterium TaxID=2640670 RepID=UPI000839EB6F|nr:MULTISPECIES: tetratricopeptide repeat protein [unclassified Phenylobacterium]
MSVAYDTASPAEIMAEAKACLAAGDPRTAAELIYGLTQSAPGDIEARYWLASALIAADATDAARATMADAVALHSTQFMGEVGVDVARLGRERAYAADIARQLYARHYMAPASVAFGRALDFENLNPQLLLSYGLSLQHQGRVEEALDVFQAAVDAFPDPSVHEFLLYALFFVENGAQRYAAEARRWAGLYAAGLAPAEPRFDADRTARRRLRIGYMAPTFTGAQLNQFVTPVLEAHDPEAVDVTLYCARPEAEAALPQHLRRRGVAGLSDEAIADMVRSDGIDVLVDLWGHTAGSRLRVFAMRPAPVQVAWMNFVQTTGLDAIDYVIHCDSMAGPDVEALFVEKVWSAGPVMVPYRPAPDRPAPTPAPVLETGRVTFGSFNNPVKLSDQTVAAWARILLGRPGSRLILKYGAFIDPVLQRMTRARFAAHGVEMERVEFRARSEGREYLESFQEIDLALDPSPCPGGTTSCDALASGVPVLTLRGPDFYARIGLNAVLACGLPDLIAEDWDDYVARALALSADAGALDTLRSRVRIGFETSVFRDEVGFTRRIEADFRAMFERWAAA